ncbi:hypothetical protein GGS23DRAFT_616947 [Durotheca rogersii]|uniref:uncharacterized protein n=1 Tax=Durotheca rogersii TaxID=419775 RepID=UPI00221F0719|nr:uncharacterized protein GGS23DRAFT_616947 [Durotheca rogersii]KAI5865832.1 hypothetical protein GGS23DRAFT_616947 [Durotheca rogersii]
MQTNFDDGLPVNFAPHYSPLGPRPNRSAQAAARLADLTTIDTYYIQPPSLGVGETTQHRHPQSSQSPDLYGPPLNTSLPSYQPSILQVPTSSSQGIWATPPSTTCEVEDIERCSFRGSPASGVGGIPPGARGSVGPSIASSESWSPSTQQLSFHGSFLSDPSMNSEYTVQPHAPEQYEQDVADQTASLSLYGDPSIAVTNDHNAIHSVQAAPNDVPHSSPQPISQHQTQVKEGLGAEYSINSGNEPHEPARAGQQNADDVARTEEPYAVLIHRAFMSRETHAMTLQELYQWFRENTDKGKSENKGWQNSIRHNLSMNHAFIKRDRQPRPGEPLTESGEPKKSTEWVLEDWAVQGVQSTTRYRSKGTSNRRGGALGSHGRSRANLSGRANSGRKGGLSASKSKAASRRATLIQRRNDVAADRASSSSSMTTLTGTTQHHPVRDMMYNQQHMGFQYPLPNFRTESATPANPVVANEMLFTPPLHPAGLPATDSHHSFAYPHNFQYSQSHHAGYHHSSSFYNFGDVTGIYQQPLPSSGQASHEQASSSIINASLSGMFPDASEMRDSNVSFAYWQDRENGNVYEP